MTVTLHKVVTDTLSQAERQGFIDRENSSDGLNCNCNNLGEICCCLGCSSTDGKTCLAVLILAGIVGTVASSLVVSGFAAKSGVESIQQMAGLEDVSNVEEPLASHDKIILKNTKKMRQLMLQERGFSALGQTGIAVAFIFLTMALAYYVHGKLNKSALDARVFTWAKRGLYAMIGGVVVYGVTKGVYEGYSRSKIETLTTALTAWKNSYDERERAAKEAQKAQAEEELPPSYDDSHKCS